MGLYIQGLRADLKHTEIELSKTKAQITHLVNESKRSASLYSEITNRLTGVRFDALQDTLRLERISSSYEWFNQEIPEEVQVVLNGGDNE